MPTKEFSGFLESKPSRLRWDCKWGCTCVERVGERPRKNSVQEVRAAPRAEGAKQGRMAGI